MNVHRPKVVTLDGDRFELTWMGRGRLKVYRRTAVLERGRSHLRLGPLRVATPDEVARVHAHLRAELEKREQQAAVTDAVVKLGGGG